MLNDDIGESRARQSGHSRTDQTWPNKILCSLGFFYNRLINRKNFHVIILKEAMNMNAAQHCVHNVFVFPSNRELQRSFLDRGYLSKDPNRCQISSKINNDHNQKLKDRIYQLAALSSYIGPALALALAYGFDAARSYSDTS